MAVVEEALKSTVNPIMGKRYGVTTGAFGHQKVVFDKTLFSSLFQLDVPNSKWEESSITGDFYDHTGHTHLPQTGVLAKSIGGGLVMTSGATINEGCLLASKRSAQYQPDSGHLFAVSIIIPNITNLGFCEFGFQGHDNAVMLRVTGDGSSFKVEYVRLSGGVIKDEIDITSSIPSNIDLSVGGHLWDIQMQLRNVGNHFIHLDGIHIHTIEHLGTDSDFIMQNPSMPAGFKVINLGQEYTLKVGCVAVKSEGGDDVLTTPVFVPIPSTFGDGILTDGSWNPTAMIAIRIPRHTMYNGQEIHVSRDAIVDNFALRCRDEYNQHIFIGRDTSLPTLSVSTEWVSKPGSVLEYMILGSGTVGEGEFQTDKSNMEEIISLGNEVDRLTQASNMSKTGSFTLTTGDIFILAVSSQASGKPVMGYVGLSEEM